MTTEQTIWTFLKNKGLNNLAVSGIIGNLYAESGLQSNNLEDTRNRDFGWTDAQYTAYVDNGQYTRFIYDQAGYGIAQWTIKSRKEKLYNLCKGRSKSISDLNCQMDLLFNELVDMGLLTKLKNVQSIREASDIILFDFENPLNKSEKVQEYRASLSEQVYNRLKDYKIIIGGNNTMKYTASNPPLKCIMTNSTCFQQTRKMDIKGVLWHSTGANNPYLKRYVQPSENDGNYTKLIKLLGKNTLDNDWNHIDIQAGVNAWIGKLEDGTIATVQTLPWTSRPWGCGSGSAGSCNDGWIQFEICEDGLNDPQYFEAVYKEACAFTAYLCQGFNLNPKGTVNYNGKSVPVILCHQDSARLGLGSNHADVYHWFGKFGKSMDTVRNDVAALMASTSQNSETVIDSQPVVDLLIYGRVLRKGRSGDDVQKLQNALIKLGYDVGIYGADGDFGSGTEKAVIAFQRDNNLDDDGEAGENTIAAINTLLQKGKPSSTNNSSTNPVTIPTNSVEIYRVRRSWTSINTQIGAFKDLESAKKICDKAGKAYAVFDSRGNQVYPVNQSASVTPARTYSGVVIGSSSKDENGRYVGGQAGDQTGKEVWILNWYDQNWTSVLRPKEASLAEAMARQCENACDNNRIGYSQSDRNSLLAQAKKVNYDLSKITTPCNCDCSSFISTICVCCGLPENTFFPGGNGCTTWTIADACLSTGKFIELNDMKYRNQKYYLKRGDILLNRNQHVVMVLSNGSNA